ncbi:hypothetical protein [Promicromonospora soli]
MRSPLKSMTTSVDLPKEPPRRAHVYVDESKAKGFLLIGVFVASGAVSSLRSALRSLRRPGQRSIHFVSERNAIRDAVLRTLIERDVSAVVVSAPKQRTTQTPRELCVRTLARTCVERDASFLVLETDQTLVPDDKRWLFEELHKTDVRYDHRERHEEPLLWAADAIAWAWNRDAAWREKVRPLVIHEVEA